ncbi:MAG: pilus assembly protein PilP [Proteobacteria bacterium]|jgi:type IV pilus assembly protein PilP|nr:pilus assembly protein PilP [Desulfocapsa sp.]MBU3945508.1 pilus assembly protein PilP [Pseudomonadota bacterium]MCG2745102.1 pilus assembly protein PilP [Desulfobacteraceae bacterium]MBU3984881.1 pilus assembly protein PilP [Pseudomonadota bacterium]MBU4029219.1 pilus assembly protein PilP [Pseudomonadota bacterium]
MKTQTNIRHLTFTLSFLLVLSGPLSLQAVPESNASSETNRASGQDPLGLSLPTDEPSTVFSYQLEGRPDPFSPFITEKATSSINMDEIVDNEETLSGMQLFEPSQLKLVAIVFEDSAELAMVEDATGQGYALRPGMKIGRKGIITTIDPNQVIIEETSVTRSGKKITNNIVMLLKKKGEE